jgi:hypothetical protein
MNCEVCGKATRQAARLCPGCSRSLHFDPFADGAFDPRADLRMAQRGSMFMRLGQSALGEVGPSKGVDIGRLMLEGTLEGDARTATIAALLESAGFEPDLFGDERPPSRAVLVQLAEVLPGELLGPAAAKAALLLGNLHAARARSLAALRIDPEVLSGMLAKERSAAEGMYARASAETKLEGVAAENGAVLRHLFGEGESSIECLRPLLPSRPAAYKLARVLMENGRCDEAAELLEAVPLESRDARWARLRQEGEGA